ncbi:MAG: tetratricopeptide repeat protein [Rhizomicrobium sp.]
MTMRFVRAALTACLLGAATSFALPFAAMPAYAAKPTGPSVSAPVAKLLQPAAKALEANDPQTALGLIKQAQALPDQTPFDTYKINEFLANAAIKTGDHATAEAAYIAMADSPSLAEVTPEEKAQTLRIAGLLTTEQKHYDKGIKYLSAFNALGGAPDPVALSSLGQAYYYSNDYANAEAVAQKLIDTTPAGASPPQAAFEILFVSQLKTNKQDAAMLTLEKSLTYYDDAEEWGQLIDTSLGVKGIKNLEGLHIYRLRVPAKAKGQADDYTIPASIALQAGYPVEAEAFLDAGIAAGVVQASGKTAAQISEARARANTDRASIKQFDALARKTATGDFDLRLAETYYGYGRYADAAEAARRALTKGGPKTDSNEANMVLGEALILQGDTAGGVAAFNALHNPTPGFAKAQHLWLLFANRKYAAATPAK